MARLLACYLIVEERGHRPFCEQVQAGKSIENAQNRRAALPARDHQSRVATQEGKSAANNNKQMTGEKAGKICVELTHDVHNRLEIVTLAVRLVCSRRLA